MSRSYRRVLAHEWIGNAFEEFAMRLERRAAESPNAEVSDTGRAETPKISGESTNAPGVRLH